MRKLLAFAFVVCLLVVVAGTKPATVRAQEQGNCGIILTGDGAIQIPCPTPTPYSGGDQPDGSPQSSATESDTSTLAQVFTTILLAIAGK